MIALMSVTPQAAIARPAGLGHSLADLLPALTGITD